MKSLAQPLFRRGASRSRFLNAALALSTGLVLAACGGGGGGSSAPPSGSTGSSPPPAPAPAPAPSPTASISASATSVAAGQPVTLTWTSANTGAANCQASGAWSGQVAASGTQQVTLAASASAYTSTYTITCGSASANVAVNVTVPVGSNTVKVVLDSGPSAATGALNVPYVSVTVCRPGTTTCQTIDHVMIDTGSYGLRLIAPLDSALALPRMQSANGAAIGECGQFVSGYTWGSVAQADIKVGGEMAAGQAIQVIGDTSGIGAAPSSCTSVGLDIGAIKTLGANGVLGIGLFKQDCGPACANGVITGHYYACSNGSCSPIAMPLAQQITNPIAAFAVNNNGAVLSFPAVPAGGATTLVGTLTFGIGTQSDNGLGNATKYTTDANGYITSVYKGTTLKSSFIDTGSNGLFFNDSTLPKCTLSTDFYCPSSPQSLSATITGANGATATIPFTIEDVDKLPNSSVAGWIGGPAGTTGTSANAFAWGLPFFFGRTVYIGLESATAGPYWAF